MSARAMMDPKKLRDHPSNKALYGRIELEPAFVDSISKEGVKQDLIVMPHGKVYHVVSGHRRRDAAILVGLEEVPVRIEEYADFTAAEPDLIALNMTRHKSEAVIAREIEKLMEIHGREAEERMKAGTPSSDPRRGGRTDDLVADMLAIPRNRLRNILVVFGEEYQAERLDEVGSFADEAVRTTWNGIREDRLADKMSLSAAAAAVQGLLKTAGKEASDRPTIRKPTWSIKWKPVPEGAVPAVFATRKVGVDTYIEFADIDGQVCLLVGRQMAPIDIDYVKYLTKEEK